MALNQSRAAFFIMYIPEGFSTVTPYFFVSESERLIEFLKDALGGTAVPLTRYPMLAERCVAGISAKPQHVET